MDGDPLKTLLTPPHSKPLENALDDDDADVYTWSSSGSSQKLGMYFAHSTKISSCCFIESQMSSSDAVFLCAADEPDICMDAADQPVLKTMAMMKFVCTRWQSGPNVRGGSGGSRNLNGGQKTLYQSRRRYRKCTKRSLINYIYAICTEKATWKKCLRSIGGGRSLQPPPWVRHWGGSHQHRFSHQIPIMFRLRNDLYCAGWGVKLYS